MKVYLLFIAVILVLGGLLGTILLARSSGSGEVHEPLTPTQLSASGGDQFVDAAIGRGLRVYKSDGTTLLGNIIDINTAMYVYSDMCDGSNYPGNPMNPKFHITTTTGALSTISCIHTADPGASANVNVYYANALCTGTPMLLYLYDGWSSSNPSGAQYYDGGYGYKVYLTYRDPTGDYRVVTGYSIPSMTGLFSYNSYWNGTSCVVASGTIGSNGNPPYNSAASPISTSKICGPGNCQLKP